MVCDQVAAGEVKLGFTDTDDVNASMEDGRRVAMIYLDQGEGEMGTLVIPNTVGIIANCPHPEAAKRFIDYLLSKEVESKLAHSRSIQMPVRPDVKTPENVRPIGDIKPMKVDFEGVADQMEETAKFVQELFIK
jgi:iron(III) transport system substrate-binding protein